MFILEKQPCLKAGLFFFETNQSQTVIHLPYKYKGASPLKYASDIHDLLL
jgi:hypothetical protein